MPLDGAHDLIFRDTREQHLERDPHPERAERPRPRSSVSAPQWGEESHAQVPGKHEYRNPYPQPCFWNRGRAPRDLGGTLRELRPCRDGHGRSGGGAPPRRSADVCTRRRRAAAPGGAGRSRALSRRALPGADRDRLAGVRFATGRGSRTPCRAARGGAGGRRRGAAGGPRSPSLRRAVERDLAGTAFRVDRAPVPLGGAPGRAGGGPARPSGDPGRGRGSCGLQRASRIHAGGRRARGGGALFRGTRHRPREHPPEARGRAPEPGRGTRVRRLGATTRR